MKDKIIIDDTNRVVEIDISQWTDKDMASAYTPLGAVMKFFSEEDQLKMIDARERLLKTDKNIAEVN